MADIFTTFHSESWLPQSVRSALPADIAVGWSGGADSTALLLILKAAGFRIRAWHVDHGWRNSSAEEALELAERAAAWDIPFFSARVSESVSSNREALARAARYAQFRRWAKEQGITVLCLAHQRNDQAETVCMRLLQGAGVAGCRGMRSERAWDGLHIVRPLLHLSGESLRHILRQADVPWLEDPTNWDMSLWRNRIRHQLFPAIRQAGWNPEELFLRWQRQAQRLTSQLDAEADAVLEAGEIELLENDSSTTKDVSLLWQEWSGCLPAVRARVLQKLMARALGGEVTPGRRHILLVEQWTQHRGQGGLDLSRCRLQRRQQRLHLHPVQADLLV